MDNNLWNGFPQDFFVGLLVDFSGVVSRFQHKLHFLHNALLSLDFLEELEAENYYCEAMLMSSR